MTWKWKRFCFLITDYGKGLSIITAVLDVTRPCGNFMELRMLPGRDRRMEEVEKILKAIQQTAEIVREHLEAKHYRNHILTLGIDGIINMVKEAIELVEK